MLAAVAVLAGCQANLEELVVSFQPKATPAQKLAVRENCHSVGKAVLEPPDRNKLASSRAYPVRYKVTNASTQDKAAVFACVGRQAGVRGIDDVTADG